MEKIGCINRWKRKRLDDKEKDFCPKQETKKKRKKLSRMSFCKECRLTSKFYQVFFRVSLKVDSGGPQMWFGNMCDQFYYICLMIFFLSYLSFEYQRIGNLEAST